MKKEELGKDWVARIKPDVLSPDSRTDFTFCGAYLQYYDTCAEYWKSERTREQNNSYLGKVILPALEDHNHKTIDQYTMEDFEAAIAKIKAEGQLRYRDKCPPVPYSDSTIQLIRNIIARTMLGASKHGLCNDIFRDSYFLLSKDDMQKASNSILFVQKSISIPAEISIIEDLLSDCTVSGETVGFLLVIACGLRLNESAAVNFGNIIELKYHPGEYKLLVYESVNINSNTLKTSGKTSNADRAIPLYDRVAQFLRDRRAYIAAALEAEGSDIDVDTLPIACVGNSYAKRCTTRQIADKARELFVRHGVKPKVFQCADLILRGSELCEIKEKVPTAYLGRHVFATQLGLLNLNAEEIQAVIGHEIEDPHFIRSDFNSDEMIHRIKQKMDRLLIYRTTADEVKLSEIEGNISGTGPLTLHLDKSARFLQVSVETEEPADSMIIQYPGGSNCQLMVGQKDPQFRLGIDVIEKYNEIYLKIKNRIQAKAQAEVQTEVQTE